MVNAERVLITQSVFSGIGGSEVQALELARYLRSRECSVTLYAWMVDSPMREILEQEQFHVITADGEEADKLSASDFDFIWVQHEVLPVSVLNGLRVATGNSPLMVFSHMSPYREVHIEQPYTYALEDSLADAVVFNAPSTREAQQSRFAHSELLFIYPNPAPMPFVRADYRCSEHLQNILVVSNHPPKELQDALAMLRSRGYTVDTLSDAINSPDPQVTSPEIIGRYDCVISIGKTVQYCLVEGIPVFVYDRFGGPGYLNADNYEQAAYYNFSGRVNDDDYSLVQAMQNATMRRLSADALADVIQKGYQGACAFQASHREAFIREYAIDRAFDEVYEFAVSNSRRKKIDDALYAQYLASSQRMIGEYVCTHQRLANPQKSFYGQTIQYFRNREEVFDVSQAESCPQRLRPRNHCVIGTRGLPVLRLDFGEQPCAISALRVTDKAGNLLSPRITSTAALQLNGVHLFFEPDPQIIIHMDQEVPAGEDVVVDADVHPLYAIPDNVRDACIGSVQGMASMLHGVLNSRWWRFRRRLLRLFHLGA